MDQYTGSNSVSLRGVAADAPRFSHESRGETFLTFPLEVRRLSGAVDRLNVLARESALRDLALTDCASLAVEGELRSFNNRSGGVGSRLVISVFARALRFEDGEDRNEVFLSGTLCKRPNLRETPLGREICDLMLAVNRRYGRSDYLPCIAWGLLARETADWQVGDRLELRGRIQSRKYVKLLGTEQVEKTAYEVSVAEAEKID